MKRIVVPALFAAATLVVAASALAHATVSPPVVRAGESQAFTLAVPTEKENAVTTKVELTVPAGFSIDSFVPSPGWSRSAHQAGAGAPIAEVTWDGGRVPTGEDATFQFVGSASATGTYRFDVRQTYSDGSVVDWSGPESSDTPAPTVEARSSFGGGDSALGEIALAVAALALAVAVVVLVAGSGKRPLA